MMNPLASEFETEFVRHCCHPDCKEDQLAQLRFAYMSGAAAAMRRMFTLQGSTVVSAEDIRMVKEIADELHAFTKNVYGPARVFNL